MKFGAIVLSAGKGTRFGEQKQFVEFNGLPLWQVVKNKAAVIVPDNIVVVGVDVAGGETRTESVRIGLDCLDGDTDRVIILEAARPLVTVEQIETLLYDDAPSVSFVMPLVNTVIFRNGDYIDREKLYELLTPQAFDYKLLKAAYEQDKDGVYTDETRVIYETYCIKPKFIETKQNLLKVTYKRDIEIIKELSKMLEEGLL